MIRSIGPQVRFFALSYPQERANRAADGRRGWEANVRVQAEFALDVVHRGAGLGGLALDHVGDRRASQDLARGGRRLGEDAVGVAAERTVEELDDLERGDLGGRAAERVAALHPALRAQDSGAAQDGEELLEELHGDVAPAGEVADRHGPLAGAPELGERAERVRALRRDRDHDVRLYPRGPAGATGRAGLQPAALGSDEAGLGAVDRAELAVDVVQVRADRARRERQLVGDLLVDLALGEALEHLDLARGERARVDLARAADRRVGQVVHHAAKLARAKADGPGALEQLGRRDGAALRVVGEHVGQADEGGVAGGVVGVVALDDRGDGLRQAPAAGEDAADQRVVDAELAALAVDALLRRAGVRVDLARVAGVGVHEHELADVVQQRGDHEAVAVLVAGLGGEAVGGALRGDAVQAEALRRGVPDGRALEEVEGARADGERLDRLRRQQLDGLDDRLDAAAVLALDLFGEPQDGDDEGDVALDRGDDVAGRHALGGHEAEHAIARLGQRRGRLERRERRRQAPAVALVVPALDTGGIRVLGGDGRDGGLAHMGRQSRAEGAGHPGYRHVWT